MSDPKIFISATSGDLRSTRQLVKEALLDIDCQPVEQTNFHPDWREVSDMLLAKITGCQALIHIAGFRYGSEPGPSTLPAGTPLRSYTQMEYDIGCKLQEERGEDGFRVYRFLCTEDYPFDSGATPEAADKVELQKAHREALTKSNRIYEHVSTPPELKARILALKEQVIAIRQEQAKDRKEVGRTKRWVQVVAVLITLVGVVTALLHFRSEEKFERVIQSSLVDTARIKAHLHEASEKRLADDLIAAELATASDERQKLRTSAKSAHESRISRINELAESFARLEGNTEMSAELKEMTRILQEENVDAALRYIETERDNLLARVAMAQESQKGQQRTYLQPLLQAAVLKATKGQSEEALQEFEALYEKDAEWPDLLEHFGWHLLGSSGFAVSHGSVLTSIEDAERGLEIAKTFHRVASKDYQTRSLLISAFNQMAYSLKERGAKGDVDTAFAHLISSKDLAESFYQDHPEDGNSAHYLATTLVMIADALCARGKLGDFPNALHHYQQALQLREDLLEKYPKNPAAITNVVISRNRLGSFYYNHGSPAEQTKALENHRVGLDLSEKRFASDPTDQQIIRDLCVSLNLVGDDLVVRGQRGDTAAALANYERGRELAEELLKSNPDSGEANSDLAESLTRIATLLTYRGKKSDSSEAIRYYQRSFDVSEQAFLENPYSASAARGFSDILNGFADALSLRGQKGDGQRAFEYLSRSLYLANGLVEENPDHVGMARGLSVTLNKLGALFAAWGTPEQLPQALEHYQRSQIICERLLKANPQGMIIRRDAALVECWMAEILSVRAQNDDLKEATRHYARSLELFKQLHSEWPDSVTTNQDLAVTYKELAEHHARLGDKSAEEKHLRACHDLMKNSISKGLEFGPQILENQNELEKRFAHSQARKSQPSTR